MTDEQNNALLDLGALLREICNDCSRQHDIPFSLIQEWMQESQLWLYEEAGQ